MKKSIVSLLSFVLLSLTGCGGSPVSIVQDGTMAGYESLTIGNAFEGSFDDADWEQIETKKGKKVVSFKGKISDDTHDLLVGLKTRSQIVSYNTYNGSKFVKLAIQDPENARMLFGMDPNNIPTKSIIGGAEDLMLLKMSIEILVKKNPDLLEEMKDDYYPEGTPVEFQWTFATDGEKYDLSWYDKKTLPNLSASEILNVIYQ